jgi:hypothetical protein
MATNEDGHAIAARRAKDDPRHDWSFSRHWDGRRLRESRVSRQQFTDTGHAHRICVCVCVCADSDRARENFAASARR